MSYRTATWMDGLGTEWNGMRWMGGPEEADEWRRLKRNTCRRWRQRHVWRRRKVVCDERCDCLLPIISIIGLILRLWCIEHCRNIFSFEHNSAEWLSWLLLHVQLTRIIQDKIHVLIKTLTERVKEEMRWRSRQTRLKEKWVEWEA